MDAIILVGGLGTRLRPLTQTRHKSLVPVCNRPAIEYLFDWAERSGFSRAVLALGRANEDLAGAYDRRRFGTMDLVIVEERERLESGGAIRNAVAAAAVEGRFAVLNGDIFVDFDFQDALARHIEQAADLTLALYAVADPSAFGVVTVDGRGLVTGFIEKPPPGSAPGNLVNAGVWIFEPGLVDEIPPGAVRVEETLFPSLVGRRRTVLGYEFHGLWADIGTPARYLELNRTLCQRAPGSMIAPAASIASGASVNLSSVGEGSRIDAGAVISESILWERVAVGAAASVHASILADGVSVGPGARLDGVVAGSGARIGANAIVPEGTRLEPGESYGA